MPSVLVGPLLLMLAAAAGSIDVLCVVRLGGPFASVITGNLIQVGRGVSAPDVRLAVTALVAVAFYAVGVAAATRLLRGRGVGWGGRTSALVAVEAVLLGGVVVGWVRADTRPGVTLVGVLLALAGCAMGVQTAVTIGAGLRGASTTYFTGALTSVVRAAVAAPGHALDRPGLWRLFALLLGAIAGGLVLRFAPLWTPVLPLALVSAVALIGLRSGGSDHTGR